MSSMIKQLDLLKIGAFLLGLSVFIGVLWMIYMTWSIPRYEPHRSPFYARCTNGVVIVSANQDLNNVTVLDLNRKIICSFEHIPKNSDDFCNVSYRKIILVKTNGYQKVVECYYEKNSIPIPIAVD